MRSNETRELLYAHRLSNAVNDLLYYPTEKLTDDEILDVLDTVRLCRVLVDAISTRLCAEAAGRAIQIPAYQ
ncbi:hypothetical protein [Nocardia sp. NPDC052566]|uniref:hypothetical protein n=1 Tax=Nocardia sp. NPDC052566 TaxID=3364330 RepID=UPI0037CB1043